MLGGRCLYLANAVHVSMRKLSPRPLSTTGRPGSCPNISLTEGVSRGRLAHSSWRLQARQVASRHLWDICGALGSAGGGLPKRRTEERQQGKEAGKLRSVLQHPALCLRPWPGVSLPRGAFSRTPSLPLDLKGWWMQGEVGERKRGLETQEPLSPASAQRGHCGPAPPVAQAAMAINAGKIPGRWERHCQGGSL